MRYSALWVLSFVVLFGCADSATQDKIEEFCGTGFCISGVSPTVGETVRLNVDTLRYVIKRESGDVYVLASNFPTLDDVTRSPVIELCHVKAWHLSPTRTPEILVLVGAEWPYWLVVSIEGDESKRRELVEFLGGIRITVPQNDWPTDIERPTCAPESTN